MVLESNSSVALRKVLVELDQMQPSGGQFVGLLLSANRGTGVSVGFFVLAFAVLIQSVMLAAAGYAKSGDELTSDDLEVRKLMREMDVQRQQQALTNNTLYNGYGAAGGPPIAATQTFTQPQCFTQPNAASSFGLPPSNQGYAGW